MTPRRRLYEIARLHPIVHLGFILSGTAFAMFGLAVMVIHGGDATKYMSASAAFWIALGQFIGQDPRFSKSSVASTYLGIAWALVALCTFTLGY